MGIFYDAQNNFSEEKKIFIRMIRNISHKSMKINTNFHWKISVGCNFCRD